VSAHRVPAATAAGPAPAAPAGSPWAAPVAGAAVGLVALLFSWHPSIWSDESASISAARRSLPDLWRMLGTIDLVHGLYYAVLHVWISVFGASGFSIRVPSAIAVGLAGACVYGLGARLADRRVAVAAVAVFAVLPRAFWAGAEARPYALTALLAAAATLALLAALAGSARAWPVYGVLLLLGILANLYVGLLLGAHLLSVLALHRAAVRRWAVTAGAAAVVALPFLGAAYGQAGQLGDRSLGPGQLVRNVVVNQFFLGDTPTPTTSSAGLRDGGLWLPAAVLLALAGWALMAWAARTRSPVAVWTVPWIVVPTAVIGLYSLVVSPMYSPRYLTFATPAVALLLATALLERRVVAAALAVLAVPVLVSQRQEDGKNGTDWSAVAAYVRDHAEPGDAVYFAPRYDVPDRTVGQTTRGIAVAYPGDFAGLRDLTLLRTPAEAGNLVGESRRITDSAGQLAGADTVWVIRRTDWARAAADDRFLAQQGLTGTTVWRGPVDVVLRFHR
jgi:mannosyltransferase